MSGLLGGLVLQWVCGLDQASTHAFSQMAIWPLYIMTLPLAKDIAMWGVITIRFGSKMTIGNLSHLVKLKSFLVVSLSSHVCETFGSPPWV